MTLLLQDMYLRVYVGGEGETGYRVKGFSYSDVAIKKNIW